MEEKYLILGLCGLAVALFHRSILTTDEDREYAVMNIPSKSLWGAFIYLVLLVFILGVIFLKNERMGYFTSDGLGLSFVVIFLTIARVPDYYLFVKPIIPGKRIMDLRYCGWCFLTAFFASVSLCWFFSNMEGGYWEIFKCGFIASLVVGFCLFVPQTFLIDNRGD